MPCHQMGGRWMGQCEFDASGNPTNLNQTQNQIPTDPANLPEVIPSQKVVLKNGDTFEITAEMVQQKIGNESIKRVAYNRQIPGPQIMVEQGSSITVTLINKTLFPTTLHSHGLRLDDDFDGVPKSMMGKQDSILPGKSFSYTLTFPDAGIYWYHPHIREDYGQEMGMYGAFLVTPKDTKYWNPVDREEVLILDDFAKGVPFFKDHTDHTLMGRYGNMIVVNNQENPQLTAKRGEKIRFYILNTANVRPFDISLDGGTQVLVGGDMGRIEKEQKVDHFILGPAERAIVEVQFEDDGIYPILNRGKQIASVKVLAEDISSVSLPALRSNSNDYASIRNNLSALLKKPIEKSLSLSLEMAGMGNMGNHTMGEMQSSLDDGIEWEDTMVGMNGMSTDQNTKWILKDTTTGKENMDIMWKFKKDDLVKIEIYNDPNSMHPMQHPIHFHGQRFVVLTTNGIANTDFQWKDTTLIPAGTKVEILLETSNIGSWMAHCHIAEHLHSGMMFHFDVE